MSVTESKAKAPVKTSKKSVNPAESAALKAALEAAQVEMVPLSALVKSPLNVRTIPYPADSVREMADSIMAIGLIQNLVVHSLPDGMSGVAAGGRRLAALQQLLSEQRIDAGYLVVAKRVSDDLAMVASMVENNQRVAMHPAEQISGFRTLSEEGKTPAQIGDLLGYSARHVQRMLKLAKTALHPFSWTLKLESPMSRRKYTFQQRLEVVMHYFATDEGYRLTSARFKVPRTQVRIWVAAYDAYGEEGLKPRDKGVSIAPDIRVEAVKAVLTGQISQTQAAAKFNVAGSASVGKWMKVFSEHGEEGLRSLRIGKKRALHMIDDPVALEAALERSKDKRIQDLEQKVRRLELRILYLKKLKALVR